MLDAFPKHFSSPICLGPHLSHTPQIATIFELVLRSLVKELIRLLGLNMTENDEERQSSDQD